MFVTFCALLTHLLWQYPSEYVECSALASLVLRTHPESKRSCRCPPSPPSRNPKHTLVSQEVRHQPRRSITLLRHPRPSPPPAHSLPSPPHIRVSKRRHNHIRGILHKILVHEVARSIPKSPRLRMWPRPRWILVLRLHQRSELQTPRELGVETFLPPSMVHFLLICPLVRLHSLWRWCRYRLGMTRSIVDSPIDCLDGLRHPHLS